MTVREVADRLGLMVFCGEAGLGREVTGGYASDLLSDVMGFARPGRMWITLRTHVNVVGVASLGELAAVVLVRGLEPDPDAAAASERESIPILGSDLPAFELAGKLYELLK